MNKADAAKYLDMGVRSLERYQSEGLIVGVPTRGKSGQKYLDYSNEELERFKREVLEAPPEAQGTQAPPQGPSEGAPKVPQIPQISVNGSPNTPQGSPPSIAPQGSQVPPTLATFGGASSVARDDIVEEDGTDAPRNPGEVQMERFAEALATAIGKQPQKASFSEKLVLTLAECRELTGYSVGKLKVAFDEGALKGHRDGRIRRVKRADLDAWVASL